MIIVSTWGFFYVKITDIFGIKYFDFKRGLVSIVGTIILSDLLKMNNSVLRLHKIKASSVNFRVLHYTDDTKVLL